VLRSACKWSLLEAWEWAAVGAAGALRCHGSHKEQNSS